MGRCDSAPVAVVGHALHRARDGRASSEAVSRGDRIRIVPIHIGFDAYRRRRRIPAAPRAASTARDAARTSSPTMEDVGPARARRRGVPDRAEVAAACGRARRRGCMAINADEGEPGTFKDRHYLETDPHRFLEGHADRRLGGRGRGGLHLPPRRVPAVSARSCCARSPRLEAEGLVAPRRDPPAPRRRGLHLRRGDGDAGEHRGQARLSRGTSRPFPTQVGLFGRPTLIHNVETVYWVRDIVETRPGVVRRAGAQRPAGPAQLLRLGPGARSPGVKLAPAGITVRELIDEYCGGMRRGPHVQGLPAGRRLGRHPARDAWPTSRSTSARWSRTAASSARPRWSSSPTGTTSAGRRPEPDAVLRGRELRPVHALPVRHREGRRADGAAGLGRAAADRAERRRCATPRSAGSARPRAEPAALACSRYFPRGAGRCPIEPAGALRRGHDHAGRHRLRARRPRGRGAPGETIWQVATGAGIEIPHLCYAPEPGYRPDGNCRACMVEIDGERVLAASCMPQADAGHDRSRPTRRAPTAARDGLRAPAGRPAAARATPTTPTRRSGDGPTGSGVTASRFPVARRAPAAPTSAIRRWPCISTPASSASCASGPAARSRSTT